MKSEELDRLENILKGQFGDKGLSVWEYNPDLKNVFDELRKAWAQLEIAKKLIAEASSWVEKTESENGELKVFLKQFNPSSEYNDSTFAGLFLSFKQALKKIEAIE